MLVVSFDIDGTNGVPEENTHVTAGNASVSTAKGDPVVDCGVGHLKVKNVRIGGKRPDDLSVDG